VCRVLIYQLKDQRVRGRLLAEGARRDCRNNDDPVAAGKARDRLELHENRILSSRFPALGKG
jgi:hypothetical protein